jgi:multidrug resistance efflux pump
VRAGDAVALVGDSIIRKDVHVAEAALDIALAEESRADRELAEVTDRRLRVEKLGPHVPEAETSAAKFAESVKKVELEKAQASSREKTRQLERVRAEMNQATIRAPFDGTVAQVFVTAGEPVTSGTPLLTLLPKEAPRLRFAIPPADAHIIQRGQLVQAHVDDTATTLQGAVTSIAPEVDTSSNMVVVEAELPGDGAAPPVAGLIARVSVISKPALGAR